MTTKGTLFVLSVVLAPLVFAAPAAAQAQRGDNEVLVFGLVTSFLSESTTSTNGTINFNIGRFVTDRTQIGGGPTISISATTTPERQVPRLVGTRIVFDTIPGETTVDATVGVSGFLRRYFSGGRVAPYLGGEVFVSDVESAGDTTFVNAIGGVKNYLSERAAIDFKGAFGFNTRDASAFQLLQFSVGLTVLF